MTAAIALTLVAASLWGSWLVSVKHLGKYPLDGFIITLFVASVIFVWGIGLAVDGARLPASITEAWTTDRTRVWTTLLGGGSLRQRAALHAVRASAHWTNVDTDDPVTINILLGTLLSAVVGGVPTGVSLGWILLACLVLISAVYASILGGNLRNRARSAIRTATAAPRMRESLVLLVAAGLLVPSYPLTLSYGLRSLTHSEGLDVLPYMALLSTGALLGTLPTSGGILARRGQWHCVFTAAPLVYTLAAISALCHYGGNIIQAYATASLSSVVSWPLAMSAGLWALMWGLASGEFRGAPRGHTMRWQVLWDSSCSACASSQVRCTDPHTVDHAQANSCRHTGIEQPRQRPAAYCPEIRSMIRYLITERAGPLDRTAMSIRNGQRPAATVRRAGSANLHTERECSGRPDMCHRSSQPSSALV